MSEPIRFNLNGEEVEAAPGETIWQVAQRRGVEIPHLCWQPEPGTTWIVKVTPSSHPTSSHCWTNRSRCDWGDSPARNERMASYLP